MQRCLSVRFGAIKFGLLALLNANDIDPILMIYKQFN